MVKLDVNRSFLKFAFSSKLHLKTNFIRSCPRSAPHRQHIRELSTLFELVSPVPCVHIERSSADFVMRRGKQCDLCHTDTPNYFVYPPTAFSVHTADRQQSVWQRSARGVRQSKFNMMHHAQLIILVWKQTQ